MSRRPKLTLGSVTASSNRVTVETDVGPTHLTPPEARTLALQLLEASNTAERPSLWEAVRAAGVAACGAGEVTTT